MGIGGTLKTAQDDGEASHQLTTASGQSSESLADELITVVVLEPN